MLLKALIGPQKNQTKRHFLKNSKTYVPPGNLALVTGVGSGGAGFAGRKENCCSLFAGGCELSPHHTGWCVSHCQAGPLQLAVPFKARSEWWPMSRSLRYQALPTSTTMAEGSTVFLSKL